MSKIRPDQLNNALKKTIAPVYLVSGDEDLLILEACDAIRSAAKKAGYVERELHHTDAGFQWDSLNHSANSLSLFSDKKIIEIRVHNGKPGDVGSKAIVDYCEHISDDNLLLLVMPKIDKRSQSSKWYKALDKAGDIVTVWPISVQELPRWVSLRMQAAGIQADNDAIDILCAKVEGNLLAASQEIEKLKLLGSQVNNQAGQQTNRRIDAATMADAVTDSARYDVFGLVDKALSGDANGAATSLQGLRGEGTEPTLILWALSREIRTLTSIKENMENGKSFDFAAKQAGVWSNRSGLIKHAAGRLALKQLYILIRKSSNADKIIKGILKSDIWNALLDIVLSLSGTEALNARSLRLNLQSQ